MFSYKFILEYITYSWTYVSIEGVTLRKLTGVKNLKWQEVQVQVLKYRKDGAQISIGFGEFKKKLIINNLVIESMVDLTNKYCPKNHDLFKIVEDIAKNRKIPLGK